MKLRIVTLHLIGLALIVSAALACERRSDPAPTASSASTNSAESPVEASEGGEAASTPQEEQASEYDSASHKPRAVITDLEAMRWLQANGFGLGERLGVPEADTLQALSRDKAFGSISRVIERDLEAFRQADPHLGVGVRGNTHRLFDPGWLRSADVRFELVAAISRLDRRPFVDDACGEVRLVYRMGYETEVDGQPVASRLPLTLALDWPEVAPEGASCERAARQWSPPEGLEGVELARWLRSEDGPLDADRLSVEALDRLLLNMQSLRWPSTVHPRLGGHAEYLMRSFVPDGSGMFEPEPLENTPDVDRLESDQQLRQELVDWIEEPDNLRRIDDGTADLPEKFLAERAISAAPRGLARAGNRPFFQVLSVADFDEIAFDQMSRVRSSAGLIRRLDDHSCAGCHQGRAVAGFHLLGQDPPETVAANALAVPISAHGLEEQRRRTALIASEAGGDSGDYSRTFSERDAGRDGVWGGPCGLTDDPTFAAWSCADGLECVPYDTPSDAPHVGVCLPEEKQVGDPCEVGRLVSGERHQDDRIVALDKQECSDGAVCNINSVGFPGGMCTTGCDDPGENGRCGAIAVLKTFNSCLAKNTPFDKCLSRHVNPAGLRACDRDRPCRHDYLCAKNTDGEGVCIPPYFLFQMRVDGHP